VTVLISVGSDAHAGAGGESWFEASEGGNSCVCQTAQMSLPSMRKIFGGVGALNGGCFERSVSCTCCISMLASSVYLGVCLLPW